MVVGETLTTSNNIRRSDNSVCTTKAAGANTHSRDTGVCVRYRSFVRPILSRGSSTRSPSQLPAALFLPTAGITGCDTVAHGHSPATATTRDSDTHGKYISHCVSRGDVRAAHGYVVVRQRLKLYTDAYSARTRCAAAALRQGQAEEKERFAFTSATIESGGRQGLTRLPQAVRLASKFL